MAKQPKDLIILRGLPGSGKSTFALKKWPEAHILSTDDWFEKHGTYVFKPAELAQAHAWNQVRAIDAMQTGLRLIVIDNTCCRKWEYSVYEAIANALNYTVTIVDLFDGGMANFDLARRNTHGVPEEVIARMRDGYEK